MEINLIYKKEILPQKKSKRKLKELFSRIAELVSKREETVFEELSIIFCGDRFIRKYNLKFLGHDYETDIITFDYGENKKGIEGELLISVETLKKNSEAYKVRFMEELARVYIHGLLHLCGYKDKSRQEKSVMRRKENYYLKRI